MDEIYSDSEMDPFAYSDEDEGELWGEWNHSWRWLFLLATLPFKRTDINWGQVTCL